MKKADFIVIAVTAVLILISCVFLYGVNDGTGKYVQVEVDGAVTDTLPLDKDTVLEISTEKGSNTLVIKNGEAAVTRADCPDLICVNHRVVKRNGESIICLPHRVVITVISDAEENGVDAAA